MTNYFKMIDLDKSSFYLDMHIACDSDKSVHLY